MKRNLLLLLMLALLGLSAGAQQDWPIIIQPYGVAVDETNFPDANFRSWILEQPYGEDEILTDAEIAEAIEIDVSNMGISDLTGVRFFTALQRLYCSCNQLTALDISKNTALETLYCDENQLTALDISKNTALIKLNCFKNQLTALDISKNTALRYLYCNNNQLTALDVSKNTALEELYCYTNGICGEGMATLVNGLYDRSQTSSGFLYVCSTRTVDGNEMTAEQVAAAKKNNWKVLIYNYNSGEWVDYPGVNSGENPGIAIDATNFPDENFRSWILAQNYGEDGYLTDEEIASVTKIEVNNMNIANLKGIEFFTALKTLDCSGNNLATLDISKNTALIYLHCNDNQLIALDVSKNTALAHLYCYNNQLTALDISTNTKLQRLNCSDNQLTALDVSTNTKLQQLYCSDNQLTALDVSTHTKLHELRCYGNGIRGEAMTTLVNGLYETSAAASRSLYVYNNETATGNEMTTEQVAIATAKNWKVLMSDGDSWVDYPGVAPGIAIDATNFPDEKFRNWILAQNYGEDGYLTDEEIAGVTEINVQAKFITDLKGIEFFTALKELYCSINNLKALDVSKNTALVKLDCHFNQLGSLNVSKNTALQYLDCSINQLTTLDVSKHKKLTQLYCYNNLIRDNGMQTLVNNLYDRSATSQGSLYVCDRELSTENEITLSQVAAAKAKNWQVLIKNGADWVGYPGGLAIDATNFPDEKFRNWILAQSYGENGYLTDEEIAGVTGIDVSGKYISNLKGIEFFTALTSLSCTDNQLTSLDVSKNTALQYLYCYNNQLTSLDVSKNTALTNLSCDGNQLAALNVTKNTALQYLSCNNNQLTTLDVSKNTALKVLYCHGNQLTTLDVSKNTKLTTVECYHNSIRGEGMATLVNSLYDRSATSQGKLYVYYYETATDNEMTMPQVAAAKAKNWKVMMADGGSWVDYPGVAPGPAIDATSFPDATFRAYVSTNFDTDKDGYLSKEEIASVKEITVSNKGITDLKGVEHFTALYYLSCYDNQLTALDVSKNTALEYLYCYNNRLTKLDVSKNTLLKSLKCYKNQLATLNLSKNTKLTQVYCYGNGIRDDGMQTLANNLYNRPSTSVGKLYVYRSETAAGNLMTSAQVTAAKGKNWQVLMYNGSSWVDYPGGTVAVTLNKSEVIVRKKKTVTLKATVTPEGLTDKSVTWKSSDESVATVSSSGVVTGVKSGVVTITCTSKATGEKATCKVTVGTITLNESEVIIKKKGTVTLTPTVYPTSLADKSVTWKSSDKTIATVSSAGVVKGVKSGIVTITCTSNATGLTATCKVTVANITLNKSSIVVNKGKRVGLTPTVYPTTLEDKSVTWKSSDKNVATVASNGNVKGVNYGEATITCTSNATGLSATCKVTVGAITLDKSDVILRKKNTLTLTPTVYPTTLEDKSVTWESSDESIAKVSKNGVVTGVKSGVASIKCTSNATGLSTACRVTVTTITINKSSLILYPGKKETLKPTVYPTTLADQSVTWKSSKTSVATVTSTGVVKGVKAGTATITCTSNATGLSTTCKVTVGSVTLDKSEVAIELGYTVTLTPTVLPSSLEDQSVTWESSDMSIATESKNGKVLGYNYGVATITCTSVATGASATCKVIVGGIELNKPSVTLKKGKTVTLKPTVYPTTLEDKSVTWKSSDKSIATVTSGGKVKGVKSGLAEITCTSNATGCYTICYVNVTESASVRTLDDGDDEDEDDEVTGIEIVEEMPAVEEPFDVFDLRGHKVRQGVTSLDGLPAGVYIVKGKKVLKK